MSLTKLEQKLLETEGSLVPVVGPGVSSMVRGRDGQRVVPTLSELFERVIERADKKRGLGEELEYELGRIRKHRDKMPERAKRSRADAIATARQIFNADANPVGWHEFVRKQLHPDEPDELTGLELARAVWSLGSLYVATVALDPTLLWASEQPTDLYHRLPSVIHKRIKLGGQRDESEARVLWHVMGRASEPNTLSLFPTEHDGEAEPDGVVKLDGEPKLLASIAEMQSLLFIGFSNEANQDFISPHIEWVGRLLSKSNEQHFALVSKSARAAFEQYAPLRNLYLIEMDSPAQELAHLETIAKLVRASRRRKPVRAEVKITRFPSYIRPDAKTDYENTYEELAKALDQKRTHGLTPKLGARIRELTHDIYHIVSQFERSKLAPGLELGETYKLVREIGRGKYAVVWEAEHKQREGVLALKILHPVYYDQHKILDEFKNSAKVLDEADHSANLVRLVEAHDDPVSGYWLYAMRYYEDGDLEQAILNPSLEPKLDLQAIIRICKDVGHALSYLHENNRYHLDVNPPNILLFRDEAGDYRGHLADVDIVQELDAHTKTQAQFGKDPFIAPELLRGAERRAPERDVFSLTTTIIWCVTNGELERPLSKEGLLRAIAKSPAHLRAALTEGAAWDPHKRFKSVTDVLEALDNSSPSELLEQVLERCKGRQGQEFERDSNRSFAQLAACAYAFTVSDVVGRVWDTPLSELEAHLAGGVPAASVVAKFLTIVRDFRTSMRDGWSNPTVVRFIDELHMLSEELNDPERLVQDKLPLDADLFLHFLLGLGYCEAMLYVSARFVDRLQTTATDYVGAMAKFGGESYKKGLDEAFEVHGRVVRYLRIWFRAKRRSEVWQKIDEFWHDEHNQALHPAIERAVSFRAFDEQRCQLITLAQVMHWEGWGGTGDFFSRYVLTYSRSPLCQFLANNIEHTFDWHYKEQSDSSINFSHRKNFFASAAVKAADYAAGCAAVLICSNLSSTPERAAQPGTFRIWGDAVGPKRVAEGRLMENIWLYRRRKGIKDQPIFELTLTDGSLPSLESVDQLQPRTQLYEEKRVVLWRDLNMEFPGEHGKPANEHTPAPSTYDCYSCAFSLHQVADQFARQQRITSILAFATRIVRPGGVLCIPDVGAGRFLQVFLLPANVVDREGGWGGDAFSLINPETGERWRRFADAAWSDHDTGLVKIPLPLLSLARGTPKFLYAKGLEIYKSTPYLVVSLRQRDVDELDEKWEKEPARRQELIDQMLARWSERAAKTVAGVGDEVWKLGYELAASPPRIEPTSDGQS